MQGVSFVPYKAHDRQQSSSQPLNKLPSSPPSSSQMVSEEQARMPIDSSTWKEYSKMDAEMEAVQTTSVSLHALR